MNLSMTLAPVSRPDDARGDRKAARALPAKFKNRLFVSVVADRIAEVRHVFPESVHRVATSQTEQQPSQGTERETAQ
jgi:hypothetical protein